MNTVNTPTARETGQPNGQGTLSRVVTLSRRDGAIQEIRRAIVRGDLVPGEKLTELSLSATLGVSRPTVREAMSQLSQEGLLVQEPYRGLHVARLTTKQIMDIARARHALDMLAVDAVLEDETGRRMAMIRQAWTQFEQRESDPDPLTRHEAHVEFHRSIWVASENSMLLRFWPATESHLTIALAEDQAVRSDPDRAAAVHHLLIAAMESGDRTLIEAAFHEHTITSAEELIAILEEENS